jgi:sporulation protein YlmC with PRC-barrel domain
MNRFLTYTAVGLFLGLTPAIAETDKPIDESQTPPAMQELAEPALPSEAVPLDPKVPAEPIPGDSSQVSPGAPGAEEPQLAPSADQPNPAAPPAQTEAQKPMTPSEAPPTDSAASEPPASDSAADSAALSGTPQFLSKQERSDWLASNLVGVSVVNANNESIGSITDLISDENGKVMGVILGAGGFLGIGQKDVAIRFEDLKLSRDEDNDVTALVDINQDTLASAPDYETLAEQQMTVGADQDRSAPGGM